MKTVTFDERTHCIIQRQPDAATRERMEDLGWINSTNGIYETVVACAAPFPADKPLAHGHRGDWYLMANARRISKMEYRKKPNWVLAKELFATGSTSAVQICIDAGIDPDDIDVRQPKS